MEFKIIRYLEKNDLCDDEIQTVFEFIGDLSSTPNELIFENYEEYDEKCEELVENVTKILNDNMDDTINKFWFC